METDSDLLSLDAISLSFGGVRALQDVSLTVRKSKIRDIIGPNGSGKRSLLNCINGFYRPQSGSITFKGEARPRLKPHMAAKLGIARTF
jgi:branched-chain amino acid transport system ATP-binding protein